MASAARGESSNPYGGGYGTGGKARKPTARRSQKTPYDRPPTSVRNSGLGGGDDRGGGWLSKLVDPAQRLITYSAHRLFASVFRKRLVSGETPTQSPEQQKQLPERDVNLEKKVKHKQDVSNLSMKSDLIRREDTNASVDQTKDGFTDLEKILQGKTFTRSEVDRLTTLLRSKAADSSTVNEANIVVRHPPSHERDRTHLNNGSMNAIVSTPPGSSRALVECVDSPAQIAKAYMGSRPSEVTPSMLGLRGQAGREDSVFLNRTPFPQKSPTMSLVPKSSGQRPLENGFVTPRSRGRSAVYSMARTPYSRPQSTVKIGSLFQASPGTWEGSLPSGSRQGFQSGLKRRSSVLDNDVGSVGPVRRIRQKSNLSSRSLALPASESPLSVRANGGQKTTHTSRDSAENNPGSSFNLVPTQSSEMASKIFQKLDYLVSPREKSPSKLSPSMLRGPALKSLQNVEAPKFLDNLPEKKENMPDSSYQKQEKSRESGSREVLAPSEKTGGTVDGTSKTGSTQDQETLGKGAYLPLTNSFVEHPPKKRAFRMSAHEDFLDLDDDHGAASTPFEVVEKQNVFKVEKSRISMPNGEKLLTPSEAMPSTSYISNGVASQGTSNGSLETGRFKFSALPTEAVQQSNMASEPTSKFIQETDKSSISPSKLTSKEKVISLEEPKKADAVFPSFFSSPAATDLLNQNAGASADIKLKETSSTGFGVSEGWAKPTESKKTFSNSASGAESTTSAASTLNGSIFSAGANAVSPPPNNWSLSSVPSFPPTISSIPSNNSVGDVPSTVQSLAATPSSSSIFGKLPADTSNDSNSQSTAAPPASSTSPFKFGEHAAPFSAPAVTQSSGQISKESEVKKSTFENTNTFKFGGMASAEPSTGSGFGAKSSENKSTPGFVFGSSSPAVADAGKNIFGGTSSVVGGSTLNPSTAASSAPVSSGSLIFGVTSSSTPVTETGKFSVSSAATNAGSNNAGSNIFGTSPPAFSSSGSSMFGSVAASTGGSIFGFNAGSSASSASAASSQSQASNLFGAANAQTGNTGSGTTTSTQSTPFQFGSSASAPTFGSSGNSSLASNSSPFVFASGSTPQLSSINSSASSSGTTSSPLFGSSWQAPNSAPVFSSSFTPSSSPSFNFGGSSAATGGSSTPAPIFGASTNTPSSSPIFGFNSTGPTTPQQPVFGNSAPSANPSQSVFGNSNSGFAFGAPNNTNGINNNNQQVSMEDSMAEDTYQANKASMVAPPMFGQPAVTMPQPNFGFGGGAATQPSSMANPFQFGGQPIPSTPQNASPFQASQSLEFQGGGSFSLGSTGGGDKSGRRIFKAKKTNRKK
ncbi:PREDICTED: nuclear pore complex protein NUP1-like [Camelina sativa]|uniref:Nuclear pore complex protein NUP1-like n=1 Tax=Camelina sativa TaxID=90675 RepID=A0ABM1R166_CAMSA|nr:PREDICTED: nuclear pore complex protein NUP1-like [Camelina sativa]